MSARSILWVDTGGKAGELHERLKQALSALDCQVIEADVGDAERMLDAIAAGAVPVVIRAADVD